MERFISEAAWTAFPMKVFLYQRGCFKASGIISAIDALLYAEWSMRKDGKDGVALLAVNKLLTWKYTRYRTLRRILPLWRNPV